MSVRARLRAVFVVYIILLAAVLVTYVRTTQRAVESGRALTTISSRLRESSVAQDARLVQMSSDAEKFLVTHDKGYFDRLAESARAYGEALRRLASEPLGDGERKVLALLAARWSNVESGMRELAGIASLSAPDARAVVGRLQGALDDVRSGSRELAAASQEAMSDELRASEESARQAERLAWTGGIGALVLSLLLSALMVRSIVEPLGRLTDSTREVSAGRFDHRLDAGGSDEFAQVARDFNSMTARLDELDRMKRDFVAKVSHDLKTPLSSMQETISALLDGLAGPLTAKQRQLLEINMESGARLSTMLSKLLDLSRIEAGLAPDFQMLDIAQIVRRSVDHADVVKSERAFLLTFEEPDNRLLVRGDEAAIAQVVDNLIENAIKFSPPGGEVSVSLAEKHGGGGALMIVVSDEGPGIPDDEKERVFSRFYQADAGRAVRGRGVGLGLTICREIVAAHGGAIWVSDNEPRGSVFRVMLPSVAVESGVGTER